MSSNTFSQRRGALTRPGVCTPPPPPPTREIFHTFNWTSNTSNPALTYFSWHVQLHHLGLPGADPIAAVYTGVYGSGAPYDPFVNRYPHTGYYEPATRDLLDTFEIACTFSNGDTYLITEYVTFYSWP